MLLSTLNRTTSIQSTMLERLATGKTINRAADNPAGLFLATGLYSQIRGDTQISQGIQLANNMLSMADNSLSTVNDSLQQIRDLAMTSANGIYSDDARAALQNQVNQLYGQISQTVANTKLNDKQLLYTQQDGDPQQSIDIYVATGNGTSSYVSYNASLNLGNPVDISTQDSAAAALDTIDSQIKSVVGKQAEIGVQSNILDGIYNSNQITLENLNQSYSTIMDTDYANVVSELKKSSLLQSVATNMFSIHLKSAKTLLGLILPKLPQHAI